MEYARKYLSASALMRVLSAIALLIAAYGQNGFQYYTFLRIGVTFVAAYLIYVGVVTKKHPWIVVFGFIAVVFNPIIPIKEATKDTWVVIDTAVAIVSLASIFFVGENLTPDDENPLTIFKNRTVQIASGLILLLGLGAYYLEVVREREIRDERIRVEANAFRASQANAANVAANAAANAANAAANAANLVAQAANQAANQMIGDNQEAPFANLDFPCDGHISNSGGNVVLRSTPGMASDNQVTELTDGDGIKLIALSSNKRWVRIRTEGGDTGWISAKFASCD